MPRTIKDYNEEIKQLQNEEKNELPKKIKELKEEYEKLNKYTMEKEDERLRLQREVSIAKTDRNKGIRLRTNTIRKRRESQKRLNEEIPRRITYLKGKINSFERAMSAQETNSGKNQNKLKQGKGVTQLADVWGKFK